MKGALSLLLLSLFALTLPPARGEEGLAFESRELMLTTGTAQGGNEEIPATLLRPAAPGRLPAIVVAHDCSGLGPRSSGAPKRWAALLAAQGYVVLLPDSFAPRGFPEGVCTASDQTPAGVAPLRRAFDAFAGLAWLRAQDFVDGAHVGLMGGSHGGSTTLVAMVAPSSAAAPLSAEKREGFAAAVALYPGCDGPYGTWSAVRAEGERGPATHFIGVYQPLAPLLILVGELDDWTPAKPCEEMAARAEREHYPLRLKVYPGARHSFDSSAPLRYRATRRNHNMPSGRGATTGGDAAAWSDAIAEVTAFFAETLKQPR